MLLTPRAFQAASGDTYANFLIDPQSIARYVAEDLAISASLLNNREPRRQVGLVPELGRVFSEHVDANWYKGVSSLYGPEHLVISLSAFLDGTVRKTGIVGAGTHLFPLLYTINNLPAAARRLSANVIVGGFGYVIRPSPADPRQCSMSPRDLKQWIRRERRSCDTALVQQIRSAFEQARCGENVIVAATQERKLVLPVLGVWQLDQPQHMSVVCTAHCGFCDLAQLRRRGLTFDRTSLCLRSAAAARELIANLQRTQLVVESSAGTGDAIREAKRIAKKELATARAALHRQSFKKPAELDTLQLLLQDPYFDFLNVSLAPMHCQKGAYQDVLTWSLRALQRAVGDAQGMRAFILACDRALVSQAAPFLHGRSRSRGLSGLLSTSIRTGPIVVRSSSKADLADGMRVIRALLFHPHRDVFQALQACNAEWHALPRAERGTQGPEGNRFDEPGESFDSWPEGDAGDDDDDEASDSGSDSEDEAAAEGRWQTSGPHIGCHVRLFGPLPDLRLTTGQEYRDAVVCGFRAGDGDGDGGEDDGQDRWRATANGRTTVLSEGELHAGAFAARQNLIDRPSSAQQAGGVIDIDDDSDSVASTADSDGEDDGRAGNSRDSWDGPTGGGDSGDDDGGSSDGNEAYIRLALEAFIDFVQRSRRYAASERELWQLQADGNKVMGRLQHAFGPSRFAHGKSLLHKYLMHIAESWQHIGAPEGQSEQTGERELRRIHRAFDGTNKHPTQTIEQMATILNRQLAWELLEREMRLTDEALVWCVLEERTAEAQFLLAECGADPSVRDCDGDPVACLAASHGLLPILTLLLEAASHEGAGSHTLDKMLRARDSDGATPLVLACLHGHMECVYALLGAGACPTSKWQGLEPIHWAAGKGHETCVRALAGLSTARDPQRVPHGRSLQTTLRDPAANRLQPVPPKTVRTRQQALLCQFDGGPRIPLHWPGRQWVKSSILCATLAQGPRGELAASHVGLRALPLALRRYIFGKHLINPPRLSAQIAASLSVRPGVVLGRGAHSVDRRIDASVFGRRTAHSSPRIVAIDPKFTDDSYVNWFAELYMCFVCLDADGVLHELCYLRWMWPSTESLSYNEVTKLYEEVPYHTRYHLANRWEVMDVRAVSHLAPVFMPPRFNEPYFTPASPYIWAPDLCGDF